MTRKRRGSDVERFGVSMDAQLLEQFDELLDQWGYTSRSEAIRDMVRERLVRRSWEAGEEVVGVIVVLYDHHQRELGDRLTDIQHDDHDLVEATLHIHLDADTCLEILAVRGPGPEIQRLADHLGSLKGVKHHQLATTSTGEGLR